MSIEFNFPSHRWCSSGGKVRVMAEIVSHFLELLRQLV